LNFGFVSDFEIRISDFLRASFTFQARHQLMHYDLIIIGMGLSGLMAAKTAAEAGKKILIVGKGMGSLCLFANSIDVLGKAPRENRMSHSLSRWIEDHPDHPYSRVGVAGIVEALSSFTSLFPSPYSFHTLGEGNCLIPTGAGTFRPTFLIPITMTAGASFNKSHTLIAGFGTFKDFYACYVADQLGSRGVSLSLSEASHQTTASALSRLMENDSFRKTLGEEIKKHLHGETRIGFPALMGIRDPFQVKKDLEDRTGCEIFEIPILPPSIPGMRIFNRFREWLIRKGVTFLLGHSVSKVSIGGRRCEGITLSNPPLSTFYSADRFILATGRFTGGGLAADGKEIFEPILHLPVAQPQSREEWFGKSFFSDSPHPVHQAGLLTDPYLRPVDEKEGPLLENVWIAGSILSHHDSIGEKSREGIEIATGYKAAKNALA
jgi:glycerol-3-phosphate dehydrogenase subunit B